MSTLYSRPDTPLSVRGMIADPGGIAELIGRMLQGSVASAVFGDHSTPAAGGNVLYQQVRGLDVFTRDPIPARAEGAEYQLIKLPEPDIKTDPVEDIGGAFEVTDEAIERSVTDVVWNGIATVGASIQRTLDERVIKVLDLAAADQTIPASNAWTGFETTGATPTPRAQQPVKDLLTVDEMFRTDSLAGGLSQLIMHPSDAAALRLGYGPELPAILETIGRRDQPVELVISTQVKQGEAYALGVPNPGGLGIEKPLTTETIDQRERRTTRVQTYIVAKPYIVLPEAVAKITAITD